MQKITFDNILPRVFQNRDDLVSEVWSQKLEFERGHLYLVEAESGKGKSTFCSYILGYRHDYTGTLMFDGRDIRELKVKDWVDIRCSKVSHLFQELRMFPELTALENIKIKNSLTGLPYKSDEQIRTWFEMLGIADKLDSKVGRMSFGQQQRVAMIRSLVQPFDFLLVDEPISHLDDHNSQIMGQIMMEEADRQKAAIIVTSIGKHMNLNYERVVKL